MKILVTGGEGYIGSHLIYKLINEHEILNIDNLSNTIHKKRKFENSWIYDLNNEYILNYLFSYFKPDIVIHLAGKIEVEESESNPLLYYQENIINSINLFKIMLKYDCSNIIFISSAAVYEKFHYDLMEDAFLNPNSVYGYTKLVIENVVQKIFKHWVIIRPFNVAGANLEGLTGESHPKPSHVITRALKTAKGEYNKFIINGGYSLENKDGSCIRDYVHVEDLVRMIKLCLNYNKNNIFNCGNSNNQISVKKIVNLVKEITNIDFNVEIGSPRQGDVQILISDINKAEKELNWIPEFNLKTIIQTAWNWEKDI